MRLNQTLGSQDKGSHKKWERNDVANTHRERSGGSITWCKGRERRYEICKIVIDFMDNRPVLMNSSRVHADFVQRIEKNHGKMSEKHAETYKGKVCSLPERFSFCFASRMSQFLRPFFDSYSLWSWAKNTSTFGTIYFHEEMNVGKSAAWWHKEQLWSRLLFTATFLYMIPHLFNGWLTGF